jgi:hypothetical protein
VQKPQTGGQSVPFGNQLIPGYRCARRFWNNHQIHWMKNLRLMQPQKLPESSPQAGPHRRVAHSPCGNDSETTALVRRSGKDADSKKPSCSRMTLGSKTLKIFTLPKSLALWPAGGSFGSGRNFRGIRRIRRGCAGGNGLPLPWAADACVRVDGGGEGFRVRLWFSCVRGSRAGACGCAWMVDRCVS